MEIMTGYIGGREGGLDWRLFNENTSARSSQEVVHIFS